MAGASLSAHEREGIRMGLEVEESLSDIARRLGRVPLTITREGETQRRTSPLLRDEGPGTKRTTQVAPQGHYLPRK
jgi:IS30 family transposase